MGSFKEHGVLIYLSKELYTGFIRLQADKELGRSYAGLLPFTEGLFRLGYISEIVYKEHVRKYTTPLGIKKSQSQALTVEQKKEQAFLESKNKLFKGMLEQWDIHSDLTWRVKVVADAAKYPNLEYSKLLITKGKECEIISQGEGQQ